MNPWLTGGGLGLVVGLIGDILLAMVFRTWRYAPPDWKTQTAATGAMTAILVLLFGGQWGSAVFLKNIDFVTLLEYYVAVLAIVITPVALLVLYGVLFQLPRRRRTP